jgi:glycosyltransferase involved in cell wall biosynthesis
MSANPPDRMKIFVLGLPHTKTLDPRESPFVTCAFTTKVWNLCKMMTEKGHNVVHLGTGGSKPICSEHVDVVPEEAWEKLYGGRKATEFYSFSEEGEAKPYYNLFARNAREAILERCGEAWSSVVCVTWGGCQWRAVDGVRQLVVESGVGYPHASAKYRAYESHAWLNMHMGRDKKFNGDEWYWVVVPNAFDPSLFGPVTREKGDYFLYIGRLIESKGVGVACQVARHLGIPLVLAGQGDPSPYLGPGVTYRGPVGVEERRELMRRARAAFVPTRYVEPFGGVAVEAALSGCPTITTDWGVFPETVLHGVTGYRCRTLDHFVWAAENVGVIEPETCRRWAGDNFSLERVAPMYEEFFQMVLDAGRKDAEHDGWKTLRPGRGELGWLEMYYPEAKGRR